jgi:hypothetical protein
MTLTRTLVLRYEECGSDITSMLPLNLFDESMSVGPICSSGGGTPGGGGGGSSTTCASGTSGQCTQVACACPSNMRKTEYSFGNPAQTCWACDAEGGGQTGNYDDDYYEDYTQGRKKRGAEAVPLPQANWVLMGDTGHAAGGTPRAANPATHMGVASWDQMKHAGWNEPANRYRSMNDFYINRFAPIPNAATDLASLKVFHARYHAARQQEAQAQRDAHIKDQ